MHVLVSDSVLRPGNARSSLEDNLLIFTIKCFCYEKYVIKNKDGSEQTEMPEFYDTRKKAWLAILDYVEDDSHIEDYIVEEVDIKDVNECITDFEKQDKYLNLNQTLVSVLLRI